VSAAGPGREERAAPAAAARRARAPPAAHRRPAGAGRAKPEARGAGAPPGARRARPHRRRPCACPCVLRRPRHRPGKAPSSLDGAAADAADAGGPAAPDAPPQWVNRVPTPQELLELSHRVYKHSRRLYSEADAQGLRVYHDERLDGTDGGCQCGGGAGVAAGKGRRVRRASAAGRGGQAAPGDGPAQSIRPWGSKIRRFPSFLRPLGSKVTWGFLSFLGPQARAALPAPATSPLPPPPRTDSARRDARAVVVPAPPRVL
jgi:hypothetical protein